MPDFDNQNQELYTILNDINACMNSARIDKMMYMFLHICEQVRDDIIEKTGIKSLRAIVQKTLKNKEIMSMIELFYIVSDGEEGRLLFDPTVADEPIYSLDSYAVQSEGQESIDIFLFIIDLKRRIAIDLGSVKREMLRSTGMSFNF